MRDERRQRVAAEWDSLQQQIGAERTVARRQLEFDDAVHDGSGPSVTPLTSQLTEEDAPPAARDAAPDAAPEAPPAARDADPEAPPAGPDAPPAGPDGPPADPEAPPAAAPPAAPWDWRQDGTARGPFPGGPLLDDLASWWPAHISTHIWEGRLVITFI